MTNLLPADELLSVRQQIKALQTREDELKQGFKKGEFEKFGNFAIVNVSKRPSKRFDRKAAEAELGDLSRFEKVSESTVIRCEELQDPNAV